MAYICEEIQKIESNLFQVDGLLGDGSLSSWKTVYIVHAIIALVSNILFCLVASSKAAWWTNDQRITEWRKEKFNLIDTITLNPPFARKNRVTESQN